jgi:hypothetical protein
MMVLAQHSHLLLIFPVSAIPAMQSKQTRTDQNIHFEISHSLDVNIITESALRGQKYFNINLKFV